MEEASKRMRGVTEKFLCLGAPTMSDNTACMRTSRLDTEVLIHFSCVADVVLQRRGEEQCFSLDNALPAAFTWRKGSEDRLLV